MVRFAQGLSLKTADKIYDLVQDLNNFVQIYAGNNNVNEMVFMNYANAYFGATSSFIENNRDTFALFGIKALVSDHIVVNDYTIRMVDRNHKMNLNILSVKKHVEF